MRLASPDTLLSVLTIPTSLPGIQSAKDALDATFATVESFVESSLLRATTTDTFVVPAATRQPALRLTHGFLTDAAVTVTVEGQEYVGALINRVLGVIDLLNVPASSRADRIITVTYTHGFAPQEAPQAPEGEPSVTVDPKVLVDVPTVLSELHLLLASSLMQSSPTNMPKDKARAIGINAARIYENKARVLASSVARPRGLYTWPVSTQAA